MTDQDLVGSILKRLIESSHVKSYGDKVSIEVELGPHEFQYLVMAGAEFIDDEAEPTAD